MPVIDYFHRFLATIRTRLTNLYIIYTICRYKMNDEGFVTLIHDKTDKLLILFAHNECYTVD